MLDDILAWLYDYSLGVALRRLADVLVNSFLYFSLSASTYNCAGCCFTWVRSYELVIMIHLQQNSNELHPQGKARRVYIGSNSSSSSTDSWLPVGCRWCEKCSLSRGLGLTTRMLNLAAQAWKQNSCYPIAGKFTVVPLQLLELHKKNVGG